MPCNHDSACPECHHKLEEAKDIQLAISNTILEWWNRQPKTDDWEPGMVVMARMVKRGVQ